MLALCVQIIYFSIDLDHGSALQCTCIMGVHFSALGGSMGVLLLYNCTNSDLLLTVYTSVI